MASMYRSGASRRKAETPGKIRIQLKGKNTVVINNDSENLDETGEKNENGDNGATSFENGIPTSLPEGTCIVQPEPVEETPHKKKREAPVKIDTSVLDNVACTACGRQVNPYKSGALHKHPVLKVVICRRCERFVTSSVISKDKAGADSQCRWCGEAGRLVVCDECSTAFCKSCVMRNFNRSEFNNINGQEKWKCYMCNKTALQPLRDNYRKIKDTLKALQEKDKSKSSASAANATDHSSSATEKLSGGKQASKVVSTVGPLASSQKTPSTNSSVSASSKSSSLASSELKKTPSSFQSGPTPSTLAQSGVKPSPLVQSGLKSSPVAQSGPKSAALNQSSPSTSTPQATPSLKTSSGVVEGQKNSSQPEKSASSHQSASSLSGSSHQSASSLSADRKSLPAQKTPAQVEGAGMAATSSSQMMNSGSMSSQKMSHYDGLGSSSHKMYSGGSHKSSSRYDSMGGYSPSGHKFNSDLSHKFFSGMGLNNIIFNLDDMNITFENVFSNISKLAIATNTFSEMLHVLQSQSQLAMSGNVNMQALRIHCVKTLNMGIESYLKSLKTILSGSPYLSDSMMYTAGMLGGLGSSSLSASEALALSRLSASPGMMSMGSNMGFHPNGDIDSYLLQQSCSPSGSTSTRHTSSDIVPETNKSAAKETIAEESKSVQQGVMETQEPQSIKEESSNNQPEGAETTPISSVDNAQTSNANLEHSFKIKQESPVTEVNTSTDGSSLPKVIEAEKLQELKKSLPEDKSLPGENKTNARLAEKLKPEYKKKLSLQVGSDFSNKLSKKLMEKDLVLTSQPAVVPAEQQVDAKSDVTKKIADEKTTETDAKDINIKSTSGGLELTDGSKDPKKQKDTEAGAVNIKEETMAAAEEAEQQDAGEGLQAVSEDEVDLSTRIQRKKRATSPARSPARGESQTAKTAPSQGTADVNSEEEVSNVEEKGEGSSPAKYQVAKKRKPASSEMDIAACQEKKTKVEAKNTGPSLKKSKPGPKSSKTGTDYVDHCVVETEQQVNEKEAELSDGEDEPPVTFYLNPADEEEIVDDGSALEIGWTEEVVDNENEIIEDDQLGEEELVEEKKKVPKSKKSAKTTEKKLAKSNGGTVTNKSKRKKRASKVNSQEQSSESDSDKDKPKKKKKNVDAEDEDDNPDKAEESLVSSIDSEEVSDSDEAVDSEEVEIEEEEAEVGEQEAEEEEEEADEPKSKKKSKGKTQPKGKKKKKKVKKAGDDDDEEENIDDDSEEEVKKTKKKKGKGKKTKKIASSDEDEDESDKEKKEGDKDDDDDEDDDDPSSSKAGKRKQIRKVMSNKRLEDSTRAANRAEEKRRKRIAAKQREFNIETITDENNPMNCLITTKLVLEAGKEEGDEPIVQVNKKLVRKLKPHQVEAVQFLWDCMYESVKRSKKEPGAGCILAHCMGLGKTLSVITFVHTILSHEKVLKHRTCLVVSPLNTVLNWRNEWNMWLDEEDRLEVWELASCKQNAARAEALKEWQASGGIMIMGYEMYRNLTTGSRCKNKRQKKVFQDTLVDPGPDLVICDEGHILKNEASAISKAMNQMKTKRRVVLTGTPLQNNLNEYHCMVSFVKPSLLGTRKEFNNRFISPIQNGQCTDSNSRDVKIMKARAHVLHEMLAGCVQRRDYSALTKFLPPKQEYVISVRLTSIQIELYEKYLQMTGQGVDGVYSNKGARLFADYQNLMKIWTHPWVLKLAEIRDELKMKYDDDDSFIDDDSDEDRSFSSSSSSSDDENGMSDGGKKGSNLKLNMQRGTKRTRAKARRQAGEDSDPEEVIAEWKSKSRTNKQGDDDGKTEESDRSVSKDWWAAYVTEDDKLKLELSNKLHLLFEILRMCEEIGDKVLIFSQSILSLNIIESFLEVVDSKYQQECETLAEEDQDKEIFGRSWTKNIDYYRMDGTTSAQNRQLWASNFNDIDNYRARLFLISTRAGGLGINLVAANRVIIFDASWNPSHDVQSIFRVYRFGQTKPCYIYRFLAQGTMEEKIYERQVTKLSLSQRVVDEHQIERHFSANDLKELYNFRPDRWDDGTEKPTLALPKDPLLAEILAVNRHCVVSFHEHDSLLENQIEQTLTEEEKKAAWEEYENEKKGIIIRGPGMERTASWPMMAAAQILSREQIQATVQALRQQLPDISEELFHLHLQQALRRQVQIKQEEMRRMELLRLQEMNYLNMIKQQAQQSGLTHAQSLQAMQNMAPWMQIQRLRAMQQSMLMGGGHFGMLPSASMSMLGQSMAGAGGLGGSKQDDLIDLDNN